jgi:hypothetical protein
MAIARDYRFPIEFEQAFPRGLVLVGEIGPKLEYQADRSCPARQVVDEQTGLLVFSATVTDPDVSNPKRASFEVLFTAKVQPVPATAEVLPGLRPIELDGLSVQPKVAGNGEFKYQSFTFRATGIRQPASSASGGKPAARSGGSDSPAGEGVPGKAA